ncbi:MAG: TRAFs-binding domain-containing protein [Cyanobacteriota bacterium]
MSSSDPRPVAFMVMPFRKKTVLDAPEGAPKEINFDALWDRAYRPALETLGYLPVRADSEVGSVIIKDMLERLRFADLVLADMTIPNGNVYYEVGIRHVAQTTNCVLIAAAWSRPLFDVDQMRMLRFPLPEATVSEDHAQEIPKVLIAQLSHVKESKTPYYELVTNTQASTVFREQLETLSAFQTKIQAARLTSDAASQRQQIIELTQLSPASLAMRDIAFELLTLVRDKLSWKETLAFIEHLPPELQGDPFVNEQALLAKSKEGEHEHAIAGLKELLRVMGETAERLGLLGGRYKKLWRNLRDARVKNQAADPDGKVLKPSSQEIGHLDNAIEYYQRGAILDLNEYFCVGNLALLLHARRLDKDLEHAAFYDRLTVLAAQRKIDRGEDDGWARSTLLGAAFRIGDVAEVARLAREVNREGPALWQLETTLADIKDTLEMMPESPNRQQLIQIYEQLDSSRQAS